MSTYCEDLGASKPNVKKKNNLTFLKIYVSSQAIASVSLKLHFYYITRKQVINEPFHIDLDITFERISNYMKHPILCFQKCLNICDCNFEATTFKKELKPPNFYPYENRAYKSFSPCLDFRGFHKQAFKCQAQPLRRFLCPHLG